MCQKITFVAPWKNSADDKLMIFFFFFLSFFFPYNNFCHANFLKFECSVKILQPEDIRKKNISEGGLLIIFTQHAKGLATGAEKKSIPTVGSDV